MHSIFQTTCRCRSLMAGIIRQFSKDIPTDEVVTTASSIKQYLTASGIAFKEGYTCIVTTCPRFTKLSKLRLAEIDKLYINTRTGYFVCHSCKQSGSWQRLKDNINFLDSGGMKSSGKVLSCFAAWESSDEVPHIGDMQAKKALEVADNGIAIGVLSSDEFTDLTRLLKIQGLRKETLELFKLKVLSDRRGVVLPTFNADLTLQSVKTVECKEDNENLTSRVIPRFDYNGVFGWNAVLKGAQEVVLTSDEFDAMAVHQETKFSVLSLPRGISCLPQEVLPYLESFTKIVFWFDNDMRSWEAAKQFSRKLDARRCSLIRPSENQPSPLKALQNGVKLSSVISRATPIVHSYITSFEAMRNEVLAELQQSEQVAGIKWKTYPYLNRLLKGHRRGEMTVFSGPTGSGKTTFISDYSLDLAQQGVNTLWGSFEIKNVRLGKMMLTQFAKTHLAKHLDKYDYWADKFEELPIYFMNFHGQESVNRVIDTMSHAVYVHDITHVILDNLQFMMGTDSDRSFLDRFARQDQIIGAFRKFATAMNCHVTLVIHPKKLDKDTDELSTNSIFGGAKASQEADNILILQDYKMANGNSRKYVQVMKNRFDGELGVMLLKFDKESLSFAPKPAVADEAAKKKSSLAKSATQAAVPAGE